MNPHEFHRRRRLAILRAAPEVKQLHGQCRAVAFAVPAVVAGHFAIAAALAQAPWYWVLAAAILVGAFAAHWLNAVIHECTHNLVLRGTAANKAVSILANLPGIVPAAMGFRHYHLLHHRFLGRPGLDADVAPAWEARLVGRRRWRKLVWLLANPLVYTLVHPLHVRQRLPLDRWLLLNAGLVLSASALVLLGLGWSSFGYLALSAYLAVGPHPTGAHILQEHLIFDGSYVTASYLGPLNPLSVGLGHHLEHHDFPSVPGPRLARLRRIAAAHYADGPVLASRLATLWRFVTDRRIGLDSRIIGAEPMPGRAAAPSA